MKKNHLTLFKSNLFLFLLVTLSLNISSCKRERQYTDISELNIETVKNWFNIKFSDSKTIITNATGTPQNSLLQQKWGRAKINVIKKLIKWDSYQQINIYGTRYLFVEISNGSIDFINGEYGSRVAVFYYAPDATIVMNIVEIFSKKSFSRLESFSIMSAFFNNKNGLLTLNEVNQDVNIITYNETYNYIESFNMQDNLLKRVKMRIRKNQSLGNHNPSTLLQTNSSNCELWGVYRITYDERGNVISEVLLYNYYVGDCDGIYNPNNQDDPGDYGGGEDESDQVNMFNQYVSMEIRPAIVEGSTSEPNGDPVSNIVTWTVAKATYAGWQILADTRYSYTHDTYFDVLNMSVNHKFTFSQWSTIGSYFVGSQVAIESTWTQTSSVDQVLNNGTGQAVGKARVVGTIKHRLRHPLPLSGSLETVQNIPGNELRFKPN